LAQQGKALREGLGHQKAVKGVLVVPGKPTHHGCMGQGHGKGQKGLGLHNFKEGEKGV
jgi:hypothetical protein